MKMNKKMLAALLAVVMLIGCAIGGSLAWLVAGTQTITNTFTYGNVGLTLAETTTTYKIVPGVDIAKDPKVTVANDSEDCYVFVKLEEENWPTFEDNRLVDYDLADGWIELEDEGVSGVYYRTVTGEGKGTAMSVLKDDKVTVSELLTKGQVDSVKNHAPQLKVTAYAVQMAGVTAAPKDIWSNITATNPAEWTPAVPAAPSTNTTPDEPVTTE